MRIYVRYSFLANISAKVDLPTRLTPSISRAVCPCSSCFQCSILSYIFLWKTNSIFFIFSKSDLYNYLIFS